MNVVSIIITALTILRRYFTKNAGMNSVTSGALGAFGVLALLAEQHTGSIDQAVTFLSNHGMTGVYVAGSIVALRTFIAFVAASQPK